jgi:hypothetical protein
MVGALKGARWRLGRTDCCARILDVFARVLEGVDVAELSGRAGELVAEEVVRTCTLLSRGLEDHVDELRLS